MDLLFYNSRVSNWADLAQLCLSIKSCKTVPNPQCQSSWPQIIHQSSLLNLRCNPSDSMRGEGKKKKKSSCCFSFSSFHTSSPSLPSFLTPNTMQSRERRYSISSRVCYHTTRSYQPKQSFHSLPLLQSVQFKAKRKRNKQNINEKLVKTKRKKKRAEKRAGGNIYRFLAT